MHNSNCCLMSCTCTQMCFPLALDILRGFLYRIIPPQMADSHARSQRLTGAAVCCGVYLFQGQPPKGGGTHVKS